MGKLRQALLERLEGDIPGFVARSGKELAGAVWCKPWCHDDALPADRRGRSAYEVFNLFTVPQARGKGIAQMLLLFAMESMAQRGKTVAFSFIFPHRVGSIVAHERVGFRKVGVMTFGAFLGRRYSRLDASAV